MPVTREVVPCPFAIAIQTNPSVDANGNPRAGLTINSYNVFANPQGLGIDPTVAFVLGFTPLPNNFNVGDGLNTAGFSFVAPQLERQYDFTTKVDHVFNDRHTLYVRWAHGAQNTFGDNVNGGLQKFPGIPNFVDTFRLPRTGLILVWKKIRSRVSTPATALRSSVCFWKRRLVPNLNVCALCTIDRLSTNC